MKIDNMKSINLVLLVALPIEFLRAEWIKEMEGN